MSFGNRLRECRESRGWTRFRLEVIIRDKFRGDGIELKEPTIKAIELGVNSEPRGTTKGILFSIFPELKEDIPKYPQAAHDSLAIH